MKKLIAMLCVAPLSIVANAAVVNGSFEEPGIVQQGVFTADNNVPGWLGATGVWRIPNTTFFNASPPDGLNIGYSNNIGTAQMLSDTVQVGLHTASVMAGRRADSFASSFTFRMYAGGTINANGIVTGGTVLAEQFFDHTTIAPNSFTPLSISYTALEGDSLIGQQVIIAMVKGQGPQMNFDQVEFTGPVPEPATILIGLGLLPFLKRKKKS